jgi:hypothetical protein
LSVAAAQTHARIQQRAFGMKFSARVIASGNASGVEIPLDVMQALGPEARPPITIAINGHSWRSRVALMRGQRLIGVSAANRLAAGVSQGDLIEVDVELDNAPREVSEPSDLALALDADAQARAAFDRLPFGLKRKEVAAIEDARTPVVRERRIVKLVASLRAS